MNKHTGLSSINYENMTVSSERAFRVLIEFASSFIVMNKFIGIKQIPISPRRNCKHEETK